MKTLKAPHARSYYKSENAWLKAVYRKNKILIDNQYQDIGSPFKILKAQISEYKEQGLTASQALKTIARSTQFTSTRERIHENFWSGLKGFRDEYKLFRELTKERGRYTKLDDSKLVWNKDLKGYVYNNKVGIKYTNSPYGIDIFKIDENI